MKQGPRGGRTLEVTVKSNPPTQPESARQSPPQPRGPRSLHADVETWTDTCSCEPEPRWQALAEELESPTPPPPAAAAADD